MAECPICYECMHTRITKLKCGHTFHKKCIDRWAEEHCTCPYCRQRFRYELTLDGMIVSFLFIIWLFFVFLMIAFQNG